MSIDQIEKQNSDVIVIGAGGAGLAAAVAAAQMGINVTVLEKLKHPGGNIMFAGGIFAAESHIQERNRIDARRDELFKIAMDYAHWRINPLIVRSFIDKSGDTIQWLEQMGLIFEDVHAVYPNQVPMVCHFPKGSGPSIVKVLVKKCEELGVKTQYQTIAKKLLLGESGKINGVIVGKDGQELLMKSKCVIIASGGYLGNRELLRKYCPSYDENMHRNGLPHMGEGITMAIAIGAATDGLGTLLAEGPRFDGPRLPRYMSSIADDPRTIWVNNKGERFIDEAASYSHGFESVNALVRQPGKVCYSIFDEKLIQEIARNGPLFASRNTFFTEMGKESLSLTEIFRNKVKGGAIKISDSWDDIADWIGADRQSFHDLIDEYNLFCECGYDKTFNKERRYLLPLRSQPYYALRCVAGLLTTIGGIKINHRMEVLDHNDNSIQGLYAAGTDTGGWVSETYCVRLTASASSYAINSGRIAAESAIKYMVSK